MEINPSHPPPPPSPMLHNNTAHGGLAPLSILVLIVLPVVIVASVILVAYFLLKVFCIDKSRKPINTVSSFRMNSLDHKNISSITNVVGYSPDVKRCIFGPMQLQASNKRGQVFTYKELEQATGGFSESNIIGNGGFGVVFRGTLSDGIVSAIKLLRLEGKQGERDFRLEVDLLSRLHSVYLVGLLGYCADQHHRLLVLEYMPNGSLKDHLHPSLKNQNQNQNYNINNNNNNMKKKKKRPLDWWTRLRIALDCARALEFLHEQTVPAVIHRDFKCSNILLDNNYRAKVSDFGMAKIGSEKINGEVLTRVLGTTGYVAPEYALTGKLTTKSDVYSFGVVLLELITGRVPVDTTGPLTEHGLVSWALPRLTNRDKIVEMVDPALQGQFSKKELIQIAAIAAVCVQSEADYRPFMTDIVQSLIPLVKCPVPATPETPSRFHRTSS